MRFSGGYSSLNGVITLIYLILMTGGFVYLYTQDRNKCLFSCDVSGSPDCYQCSDLLKNDDESPLSYLPPSYLFCTHRHVLSYSIPAISQTGICCIFIVILIGVMNAPLLAEYYTNYTKEDWRGFAGIVQSKTQEGDMIVLVPSYISVPFNYYYSNVTTKRLNMVQTTALTLENIYQLKGNNSIFYIVTGDISAMNPEGDALSWLSEKARLETERTGIYLLTSQ